MNRVILGTRGTIARALSERFPGAQVIPRDVYSNWTSLKDVRAHIGEQPTHIYASFGIIGSEANSILQEKINVRIPILIAQAIRGTSSRITTFGTVMERFPKVVHTNRYVGLKLSLSEELKGTLPSQNYQHLRLHTLYGGEELNTKLFLGKILESILRDKHFTMSSGNQLRQYHHVSDVTAIIADENFESNNGNVEVGGREFISLKDIAECIFEIYGKKKHLIFDSSLDPQNDIYEPFKRLGPHFPDSHFREVKSGILEYCGEILRKYGNLNVQH